MRPYPLFFDSGKGAQVTDVDGNVYVDYGLAWGPLILGHARPEVTAAVSAQAARALTFGAQDPLEYEVAERLQALVPCAEQVCFALSGTEAVQNALRLARAVTGRRRFVKFEGHYHGWADNVLVSYHPTAEEIRRADGRPIPVAHGQVPPDGVIVLEWNDREGVERAFERHGDEISAVICEPLLCNSGCIPPADGFLAFLRSITARHSSLLVFDEVITGFRLGLGGAQEHYGVTPDLATFAKAIGGGTALSALAGRREYLRWIADGRVVHAGTLNGNPLSLAAAKATLDVLASDGGAVYRDMWRRGQHLAERFDQTFRAAGLTATVSGVGPVFHVAFMAGPITRYRDLLAADTTLYGDFVVGLLDEGVLALPDGRWYISAAHTDEDIERTAAAVERIAGELSAR
jgi:glutamate-1-semialdehyde 2,1-aminomutase